MRPAEDIKKLIEKMNDTTGAEMDKRVLSDILEALAESKETQSADTRPNIWRIIMTSRITKLAAAAVIIIAVLFGVGQFFGGTVTFAQVIEPILNAHTVIFDYVVGSEETGSIMHNIVVDSKIRRTFSNMDLIFIIDLDTARMLTLDPKSKDAAYVNIEGPLKERTKDLLEFIRKTVTDLKDLPVEELGRQNIDGLEAIGFKLNGSNTEITIWADPETAKPIHIEVSIEKALFIFKNFEFDVPVDESLLSMEPPDGYTLSDRQFDMTSFTEQDFIALIQLLVEYELDGNFPQSLSVIELMNQNRSIGEKMDQLNISDDQKMQFGLTFGRGLMFFQQMRPMGVDWKYVGNGVKLGEADKPVFWYQPKNSNTYRVIYGDLSAEDVLPEDLPK
jgi:hypothetical protein